MRRTMWISFVSASLMAVSLLGSVTAQSPDPQTGAPETEVVDPARSEGELPAEAASPQAVEAAEVALGSAISYQGQLKLGGVLVNGTCDMALRAYNAAAAGSQVGVAVTTTVAVNNGLFTIAPNFGTTVFEGDTRWLELRVRCPTGVGAFVTLAPRQQLFAAPYALTLRPGATVSATTSGNVLNLENYGPSGGRAAYFRNTGGSNSATLRVDNEGSSWGIYSVSARGTAVEGISTHEIGVIGRRNATTGTLPAIAGYSASTSASAIGVLGQINSGAPGGSSAGVRGINNGTSGSGIGVWGSQAGTGWGVYGTTPGGIGVYGFSTNGRGVQGSSTNDIGVYAFSSGSGVSNPALYAYNSRTGAEPSGIAIYAQNASGDATIVARNTSTGDSFRALNAAGNSVIYRVTQTGRVIASAVQIYGGGDLAERFETHKDEQATPGTLMVIDENNPGKLKMSTDAYDSKVAGIVSGAGGVNPGMTLHQEGVMEGDAVVALAGRVYVKADASKGKIKPGDLLTTSDTPGHAMKVSDRSKAQGATIGKAMTGLDKGTGLVLVLVNLQ